MDTKLMNVNVKFDNKNVEWYLLVDYPDKCYNYYLKSIFMTLIHEPEIQNNIKYNLNYGLYYFVVLVRVLMS